MLNPSDSNGFTKILLSLSQQTGGVKMKIYEILDTTCDYLESCRDELLEEISDGVLDEDELIDTHKEIDFLNKVIKYIIKKRDEEYNYDYERFMY